jgi:beta-glucanase (GH16 family)
VYYFNDAEIFRHDTPAEMNTPMYLLANLAVGGSWGGYPEDGAVFPKYLEIDYIRAYAEA